MPSRAVAAAVFTLTVASLTGCDSDSSPNPTPFTPSTSTATPTPTNSAEDTAVAAASTAYRQFVAATDVAYASGGVNIVELKKYASGVMLAAELNQAETFRGKKWHSVGSQQVVWVKAMTVGKPDAAARSTT